MKPIKRAVFAAMTMGCVSAVSSLWADARPNPYLSIVQRNPFGIKEPPPQVAPEKPEIQAPLAKVVLTGVTSMFGEPRALLEITESEPGKGPVINKRTLKQGERDGSIEILQIDVVNAKVRIKNGPIETNVVFEVAKAGPQDARPMGPTQFQPPHPNPPGTPFNSPMVPNAGAANAASSPYILSPDSANSSRNGGVTLMGATPAAPAPVTPGVAVPGSFPNLSSPTVNHVQPTANNNIVTYGSSGTPPTPTTYGSDGKPIPLRNVRALPTYPTPPAIPGGK
jgi:hypothetical protein